MLGGFRLCRQLRGPGQEDKKLNTVNSFLTTTLLSDHYP